MRQETLTVIKGGLSRLRTKGAALKDTLFKLTNGHVTFEKTVVRRPGTLRHATLPSGTFGLLGFDGGFHVFATSVVASLPADVTLHVLLHPGGEDLKKIHFAKPYLGAIYVVAEFDNDDVYHFWLQPAEDDWQADTEYSANEFVTPTTPNGFVYKATRLGDAKQSWAPNVPREVGDEIEPTTYNEYYYEAIEANGDNPRSAEFEPVWPTNTGETIIENAASEESDENESVSGPEPPSANRPQVDRTGRYRRGLR